MFSLFGIVPKKFSEREKEEMMSSFSSGATIDELSQKFNRTTITISRHLKKIFNESKFKEINFQNNQKREENINKNLHTKNNYREENSQQNIDKETKFFNSSFIEIPPINCEIDNLPQKDLSSIHISEVDFPKVVYMIVDKKIELQIKYLKEYPEWQFLSQDDLNRKTIEIFFDLKIAKRFCNIEQKVIKVPNTEVFRIVAPLLLAKGISRIVSSDKLIAL